MCINCPENYIHVRIPLIVVCPIDDSSDICMKTGDQIPECPFNPYDEYVVNFPQQAGMADNVKG